MKKIFLIFFVINLFFGVKVEAFTVTPSCLIGGSSCVGANGSIDPNIPVEVSNGDTTIFTVTPNINYSTLVVGTCGGNLVGTTYTTNIITNDCTVIAIFPSPTGIIIQY